MAVEFNGSQTVLDRTTGKLWKQKELERIDIYDLVGPIQTAADIILQIAYDYKEFENIRLSLDQTCQEAFIVYGHEQETDEEYEQRTMKQEDRETRKKAAAKEKRRKQYLKLKEEFEEESLH